MTRPREGPILTLEPLIEAVREGVENAGWTLSGLQKTTSHQFEGRWEGESTRSAYLFFHLPDGPDHLSVDVYLDETSKGLTGNLALVVDLLPLPELGDPAEALEALASVCTTALPERYRTPLTLRLRLADPRRDARDAEVEARFKIRVPRNATDSGHGAVVALAREAVRCFDGIRSSPELGRYVLD